MFNEWFLSWALWPMWLALGFSLVLGLLVGSFLNVVIGRLPIMLKREWEAECADYMGNCAPTHPRFNLAWPPSHCPQCQTSIRAWQNIPVISYFLLKGRCASCQQKISWRYPFIELLTGLAFFLDVWVFGWVWWIVPIWFLTAVLMALIWIDIDEMLLPDQLTLLLLWGGLLFSLISPFVSPAQAIAGAALGYLSLWSVYWLFKLTTGKEGMGYGDFKLLAALGAWLGWEQVLFIILCSSFVGAIIGGVMFKVQRSGHQQPIPYGPYLAIAGYIALLFGSTILNEYWRYVG